MSTTTVAHLHHETADRNCAFWDGTRSSFMVRLTLGIRCVICSNVGAALGFMVNPPSPAPHTQEEA